MILDDIVQAINLMEEQRRAERDEHTELDGRLNYAGEDIRSMAVNREVLGSQKKSEGSISKACRLAWRVKDSYYPIVTGKSGMWLRSTKNPNLKVMEKHQTGGGPT